MAKKVEEKDLSSVFNTVDGLLSQVNVEKIDPNAPDFDNLPEGYYSVEVVKAELTVSKSSDKPQIKLQLKTVENGLGIVIDEDGDSVFQEIEKTKDRMLYKYYPLTTKAEVEKMIKDMLKFEGDEPGGGLCHAGAGFGRGVCCREKTVRDRTTTKKRRRS